jgi:hypothetical protein
MEYGLGGLIFFLIIQKLHMVLTLLLMEYGLGVVNLENVPAWKS